MLAPADHSRTFIVVIMQASQLAVVLYACAPVKSASVKPTGVGKRVRSNRFTRVPFKVAMGKRAVQQRQTFCLVLTCPKFRLSHSAEVIKPETLSKHHTEFEDNTPCRKGRCTPQEWFTCSWRGVVSWCLLQLKARTRARLVLVAPDADFSC